MLHLLFIEIVKRKVRFIAMENLQVYYKTENKFESSRFNHPFWHRYYSLTGKHLSQRQLFRCLN